MQTNLLPRTLMILFLIAISIFGSNAQGLITMGDTTICPPDSIDLSVADNISAGTSTYMWEEIPFAPISISGTVVNLLDDASSNSKSLGFNFCFFGNTYSSLYIASNGWVTFSNPLGTTWPQNYVPDDPIPNDSSTMPKNAIMAAYKDWITHLCTNCIFYKTEGVAPNRTFAVIWDSVPMYLCTDSLGSFQIVLHETTNIIDLHLTHVPACPSWQGGYGIEGVHNISGTSGFAAPGRNKTVYYADSESNSFLPDDIYWFEDGVAIDTGRTIRIYPAPDPVEYTVQVTSCTGLTATDTVIVDGCIPCGYSPTGLFVSPLNSTSAKLHWGAVDGATKYKIQYGPVGGTITNTQSLSLTKNIAGLTPGVNYFYRVRAKCPGFGMSTWSAPYYFTTPLKESDQLPLQAAGGLTIYPNPATDKLTVTINPLLTPYSSLLITDITGKTISTFEITSTTLEIDISELAIGMYFITAKLNSDVSVQKFIKQ